MASASDFKDAVDALQKTNAELGRAVGDSVKTGLKGAAKDITKPFTDSLSAIPGMSTLGGLGKTLFNKALSTRKEKKAQELLRKQLGVSKEQFKLLKDEKSLSDKRQAVNDSLMAASENLLGFSGEKFSAMMAGAFNPGMNRVIKGHGENAQKTITGMDTLFKDQMKATISGNKLLENPKPTAAETEAAQKAESKAAREQSVFHDIRDGVIGLNDTFMQKMKEKGSAGLGLIAALIAAPIVALLAFFKEIGSQLKMLGITGKGGLVAKMFAPIGKLFAGIKNFFKAFTVVKKITPFIDDIIKGVKTVLKPIGSFFSKLGGFFSKMIRFVKPLIAASGQATGILKFASGFGRILGKLFLPVTIVMSAFDFITGFIDGWAQSDGDSIVSKFIDGIGGALSSLVGNLIGMPLDLLKDGVSFIMGMLGFDKAAAALDSFSFKDLIMDIVKMPFDLLSNAVDYITGLFTGGTDLMGDMGNIMDIAKNFIKSILRSVLPNPDGGFIAKLASKAIPDSIYKFAGLDPKTGQELPKEEASGPTETIQSLGNQINKEQMVQGKRGISDDDFLESVGREDRAAIKQFKLAEEIEQGKLSTKIKNVVSNLGETIGNFFSGIKDKVLGIFGDFMVFQFVQDTFDQLFTTIKALFGGDFSLENFTALFGSLLDIVYMPLNLIVNTVKDMFSIGDPNEPFSLSNFIFGPDGIITKVVNFFTDIFDIDFGKLFGDILGSAGAIGGKIAGFLGFGGGDEKTGKIQLPLQKQMSKEQMIQSKSTTSDEEHMDSIGRENVLVAKMRDLEQGKKVAELDRLRERQSNEERITNEKLARQSAVGGGNNNSTNISTSDKKVENHYPAMTQPQSATLNANLQSAAL